MSTEKGWLIHWWEAMAPFPRTLLVVMAAPLMVLNAWALFAIADYFNSLVVVLAGASLVAFLLNYPVSFLQRRGMKRERAAIIVFLMTLSIILAVGLTLLPSALQQAQQLVNKLPEWFDSGQRQLIRLNDQLEASNIPFNLDALLRQTIDPLKNQLQRLTSELLGLAVFTVTKLLDVLLTTVLAFYLLQHGDGLWHSLVEWLPSRVRQPFTQTLRLSFQNFFLGQLILATSLGVSLTLVFLALKVPFGLLFGLTIGVVALVPFGGSVGIVTVTLLVSLQDISLGVRVLATSVLVQQLLENLIAPRILGSMTGLNPVWVLISVLAGARVAGLLGVVVAVPTAVVVKSILMTMRVSPKPLLDAAVGEAPPEPLPPGNGNGNGDRAEATDAPVAPAEAPSTSA